MAGTAIAQEKAGPLPRRRRARMGPLARQEARVGLLFVSPWIVGLVQPALIVVAVFTLLATWNDYFGPLIYLSDTDSYPLSLGLYSFRAQRSTEWALLMAASVLVTLPMIALFAFGQRYFLNGIKTTGLVR